MRVWRGEGLYHLLSAFPTPASKAGKSGRRLARLASLSEKQHHMARHAVVVVVIETEPSLSHAMEVVGLKSDAQYCPVEQGLRGLVFYLTHESRRRVVAS